MAKPLSFDHRILAFLTLVSFFFIGATRLVLENSRSFHRSKQPSKPLYTENLSSENGGGRVSIDIFDEESVVGWCNLFEGKWVLDNSSSYPPYTEESCPYLTEQVTCQKNGRPDSLYQKWRWEPHACKLPRFDAMKLLEVLKGKTLIFIGDSIQRSQWESMVCLIHSSIPDGKKSIHRDPPMKIFKAEDFNTSIIFYWAPFLVESNSDHATKHTVQRRLVKLDSIAKHSQHWEGADVLVFESYVWWMYKPLINATNGVPYNVKEYNVTNAYKLAIETWGSWLESKINPRRQKVFFMSLSPTHLWDWEWKAGGTGNCFNESYPIQASSYWGAGSNKQIMWILRDILEGLMIDVTFLNITQLSEFRKDAHTSVYTERRGKLLTGEEKSNPDTYADCIHWCLPGVPDTWNEILYTYLLHNWA